MSVSLKKDRDVCREWSHAWVGGMCYLSDEDVEEAAKHRPVHCERCGAQYRPGEEI